MNYTENCHLPQWEESDRVLRTDFNEAFAALEEIGADHQRLRTMAGNLGRDLYRREVQSRVCHGKGGGTDGMWVNALETRESAGGDGHGWNGRYGICHGGSGLPTLEGIKGTAEEEDFISTVSTYTYQSRRAAVTFVSDGYGTMKTVTTFSWYHSGYTLQEYPFTITLTRVDDGSVVGQFGPIMSVSASGSYSIIAHTVNFPLEPHVQYRLEYSVPDGYRFYGKGGFVLGNKEGSMTAIIPMTMDVREAAGEIEKTVTPPQEARGAVGLVRWSGEGTVGLSINGEPMELVRTRETVNAEGKACWETEFSLEALPEGELTAALEMTKGDGDLDVFDYGLIWK